MRAFHPVEKAVPKDHPHSDRSATGDRSRATGGSHERRNWRLRRWTSPGTALRSLIARGLRSRGYGVIEASNGVEALEALEQRNGAVDLVVSDVVMPEMDGPNPS